MLRTNEKKLIMLALQGRVSHPDEFLPYEVGHDGKPRALPGTGSITYNVKVGDPAFGWKSDHTEPGVSTVCTSDEKPFAKGYNFLACCGNEVRIVTGDAKGAKGTVIGTHGGVEHVMIDFPDKVLEKLTLDDKFLIKSIGQGLELTDFPEILCYNLSPALLKKMNIQKQRAHGASAFGGSEAGQMRLRAQAERRSGSASLSEAELIFNVGVTHIIPAKIMGSGIGSLACTRGDYDITTQDPNAIKEFRLDTLRLGDIIAIQDSDNSYGRCYKKGAISICVVVHCNSFAAGHGPGVMTLMTCAKPRIKAFIDKKANVAELLEIGRYGKKRIKMLRITNAKK